MSNLMEKLGKAFHFHTPGGNEEAYQSKLTDREKKYLEKRTSTSEIKELSQSIMSLERNLKNLLDEICMEEVYLEKSLTDDRQSLKKQYDKDLKEQIDLMEHCYELKMGILKMRICIGEQELQMKNLQLQKIFSEFIPEEELDVLIQDSEKIINDLKKSGHTIDNQEYQETQKQQQLLIETKELYHILEEQRYEHSRMQSVLYQLAPPPPKRFKHNQYISPSKQQMSVDPILPQIDPKEELKKEFDSLMKELDVATNDDLEDELKVWQDMYEKSKKTLALSNIQKIQKAIQIRDELYPRVDPIKELQKKMAKLMENFPDIKDETQIQDSVIFFEELAQRFPKKVQLHQEQLNQLKEIQQIQSQIEKLKNPQQEQEEEKKDSSSQNVMSQQQHIINPEQVPLNQEQEQIQLTDEEKEKLNQAYLYERELFEAINIMEIYEGSNMPPCFELSIVQLLYFMIVLLHHAKDVVYSKSKEQIHEQIQQISKQLDSQCHKEKLNYHQLSPHIKKILQDYETPSLELVKSLRAILLEIRMFSFQEFFDLYNKADEAAHQIAKKNVILMLGATGCGKSTTIHYLGGSKLERKPVKGLDHIQPTQIFNKDLLKVRNSPYSKSETRYIATIRIDMKSLGYHRSEEIILVDSPGSEDTESSEVDLSNGLSIIKAISVTQGIRPVIIFSFKDIGSRKTKFKQQLFYYIRIIKNVAKVIKNFIYCFSHCQKESTPILAMLEEISSNLSTQEQQDDNFKKIIDDMIEKAKEGKILILDPLDGKPLEVLKKFLEIDNIMNPSQAFQMAVSESTHSKIITQFAMHEKAIMEALLQQDENLITFKIKELQQFLQIFSNNQSYINKYLEILKKMHEFIKNNFDHGINQITKCLSFDNTFTHQEFNNFKKHLQIAQNLENITTTFLQAPIDGKDQYLLQVSTPTYGDMIAEVVQQTRQCFGHLQNNDIDIREWSQFLKKTDILSELENPTISELIKESFNIYYQKLNQAIAYCLNALNGLHIQEYSNEEQDSRVMQKSEQIEEKQQTHQIIGEICRKMETAIQNFNSFQQVQEEINKQKIMISQLVIKRINQLKEQYISPFLSPNEISKYMPSSFSDDNEMLIELHPEQIKKINSFITLIESFKASLYMLTEHDFQIQLEQPQHDIIKRLMEIYSQNEFKIREYIKDYSKYSQIKVRYDQIIYLMEVQTVGISVRFKFNTIMRMIENLVETQTKSIQDILQKMRMQQKDHSELDMLQQLKDALYCISDLSWISSQSVDFYKKKQQDLRTMIQAKVDEIEEAVKHIIIDVEDSQCLIEIDKAQTKFIQLSEICNILNLQINTNKKEEWYKLIKIELEKIRQFLDSWQYQELDMSQRVIKRVECMKFQFYHDFLNQLYLCSKIVQGNDLASTANHFLQDLKEILDNQREVLKNEIEIKIQIIKESEEITKIEEAITVITQHLKLIKEMKENHKRLWQYLDKNNKIDDEIIERIQKELFQRLIAEISTAQREQNNIAFNFKMNILHSSTSLSAFVFQNSEEVQRRIDIFERENVKQSNQTVQMIATSLNENDYDGVVIILTQAITSGAQNNVIEIQKLIQKKIKYLIKQIESSDQDEIIDPQQADQQNLLIGQLQSLTKQINKEHYPDLVAKIESTFQKFKNRVAQSCRSLTESANIHLRKYRFYSAFESLKAASLILKKQQILQNNGRAAIDEGVNFQSLQAGINKAQQFFDSQKGNLIKKINEMDLFKSEQREINPKEIMENLIKNRQEFSEFIEQIQLLLNKRYNEAIAIINNDFKNGKITDSELKSEYAMLKNSLESLPNDQSESIGSNIILQLSQIEMIIQSQSQAFDQQIESAKELNQELKNILDNAEKKKMQITQKHKDKINKLALMLSVTALRYLEVDNFERLFNESMPKVYQAMDGVYAKHYSASIEQELQQLFSQIRKKFDCIIQVLIYKVSPHYQELCNLKNVEIEEIVILSSIELKDGGKDMITSIEKQNDEAALIQILVAIHKIRITKPEQIHQVIQSYDKRFNTLMERGWKILIQAKQLFEESIKQEKIQEAAIAIMFLKQTQQLYKQIRKKEVQEILVQGPSDLSLKAQAFWKEVNETKYEVCVKRLEPLINKASENFNFKDLINDKTRYGEKERNQFYQNLKDSFLLLESALIIKNDIQENTKLEIELLIKMSNQNFDNSIQNLTKRLQDSIKSFQASDKVEKLKDFGHLYSNIESLIKIFPEKIEILKIQEQIDKEIEIQLETIRLKAIDIGSTNIQTFVIILISLQKIRENILMLDQQVTQIINEVLEIVTKQQGDNLKQNAFINNLAQELKSTVEGDSITKLNPMFEGYDRALFNEKILKKSLQEVLSELTGDNISRPDLESAYNQFIECYRQLVKENLKPNADLESLRSRTFLNSKKYEGKPLDDNVKDRIPLLVAHIFSLWTLLNAEEYFKLGSDGGMMQGDGSSEDQNAKYLLQPHIAQVISIFRVLGIGYTSYNKPTTKPHAYKEAQIQILGQEPFLYDNLVQIKTGEGKSVTLAVVSIVFALYGFEVNCVCFSEYLSKRDFEAFSKLFQYLQVDSSIFYGTFNQICEKYINKDGAIRDLVLNRILKNQQSNSNYSAKFGQERPKALLIDEVDVFFSKEFYNAAYLPMTLIKGPQVSALIDLIWERREEKLTSRQIKATSQYQECAQLFLPQFIPLLDGAIRNMLIAVQPDPVHNDMIQVVNGKIGYKDQDAINFKVRYGYKTVFAYYREYDKKTVSFSTLNENKAIGINCGVFSYAEIPHYFCITMGVTGTLKQLTQSELNIIKEIFQIRNFTYSPSVYGPSNLFWKTNHERIKIESNKTYYREIVNQMTHKLAGDTGKRAVLIFFKSEKHLENFFLSSEFESHKKSCQKLTELLNEKEKKICISKATYPNTITLSTPSFGRGTDFICRDQGVERNGGVHVIQTYFSEQLTEYVQIKGRTARQGNKGSYSMILLDHDLKEFNIEDIELISEEMKMKPHKVLKRKREEKLAKAQLEDTQALDQIKKQHEQSWTIKDHLLKNDNASIPEILKFLQEVNPFTPEESIVKTLVLMDATGSMSSLLNNAKNAVSVMFESANNILKEHQIPENCFMIQYACYRNYSSGKDQILEHSGWEANPIELRKFLETVKASGGQGDEAIEIGLFYANRIVELQEKDPLSQIFIIGDMPPNTREEVAANRKGKGDSHWVGSQYEKETYWETELEKLKAAKIPVYPFYVDQYCAKKAFELLAINGGEAKFLDVNNEKIGQKLLIDMITTQVLAEIGERRGGSELAQKLVQSYYKSYSN